MTDILEEIKKSLAHQFGLDPDDIEEDSLLDEDLSITDLDLEDFLSKIQEKYEITISAESAASFKKVSDIVNFIYDNAEIAS